MNIIRKLDIISLQDILHTVSQRGTRNSTHGKYKPFQMQHQQLRACMPRALGLTLSTNRVTTATIMIHAGICAHLYSCDVVNYSLQLCTLRGALSYCHCMVKCWSCVKFVQVHSHMQSTSSNKQRTETAVGGEGIQKCKFCHANCVSIIHEHFHS